MKKVVINSKGISLIEEENFEEDEDMQIYYTQPRKTTARKIS
jgi:hypothetical protein